MTKWMMIMVMMMVMMLAFMMVMMIIIMKKQHLLPSCQSLGAFQTFTNDAGCGEMVTGMTMIK